MSDKHPVALSGEAIQACQKSKPKTSTVAGVSLDRKTQILLRLHVSPLFKTNKQLVRQLTIAGFRQGNIFEATSLYNI